MLNSAEKNWESFPGFWSDSYFLAFILGLFAWVVLVAGDWCHSQSLTVGLLHSLCVTSSAPVCAGGGEGLQGTEIHEFSPCRHSTGRDVWVVDMNGPRGDPKAVLPFPSLMLLSAMPEAARMRSKGASSPSKSGEAAWILSCPAWNSVLSEAAGNSQVAEKAVAGQGLSMGCLIPKPVGVPGYQVVVHVQVLSETSSLVRGLKAKERPHQVMPVSMGWEQEAAAHCSRVAAAESLVLLHGNPCVPQFISYSILLTI